MKKIGYRVARKAGYLVGEIMKYVEVTEEERFDFEFKEPKGASYFIINAFNNAVYFFCRDRNKAQSFSDELYGVGKYIVRPVIRAQVR